MTYGFDLCCDFWLWDWGLGLGIEMGVGLGIGIGNWDWGLGLGNGIGYCDWVKKFLDPTLGVSHTKSEVYSS